jgi:hypothetical protein
VPSAAAIVLDCKTIARHFFKRKPLSSVRWRKEEATKQTE